MPEGTAIWALADGKAGNRSQAFGVADALGQPYREICIDDGPLGILPNILLGASLTGIDASSRNMLTPPWPDLVIAAGRRTAPVARWIKHRAGGKTKLCQIMDPGAGRSDFDLIAWPAHDRPANAANVMAIKAAPHRITPARLAAARVEWAGAVDELPMPRIAVLVGGSTRRRRFTDAMARELGEMTNAAADAG
ncbi:MAG: ELM1/GtrOC1 family putative glycosyltransferase, partial [Proteobacteria bacterium]|nr:ELM1/GtrOC1 family putative glycosyltransferase [Pseudomonadota bacterium]